MVYRAGGVVKERFYSAVIIFCNVAFTYGMFARIYIKIHTKLVTLLNVRMANARYYHRRVSAVGRIIF